MSSNEPARAAGGQKVVLAHQMWLPLNRVLSPCLLLFGFFFLHVRRQAFSFALQATDLWVDSPP